MQKSVTSNARSAGFAPCTGTRLCIDRCRRSNTERQPRPPRQSEAPRPTRRPVLARMTRLLSINALGFWNAPGPCLHVVDVLLYGLLPADAQPGTQLKAQRFGPARWPHL